VPACSSSPIAAVANRLAPPAALAPDQCRSLLGYLAQIADPRHRRGRRHPLVGVLGVAVCAVLAGARSLVAIGEWASDAPWQVLAALGTRRDPLTGAWRPPGEATVRRVLAVSTPTPSTAPSALGWPASSHPHQQARHRRAVRRIGRSRSTARPCAVAATTATGRCTCWR
jgi:DDE_Tnp_1-associated